MKKLVFPTVQSNIRVGYKTYSLETIKHCGSCHGTLAKAPVLVQTADDMYLEHEDFLKLYHLIEDKVKDIKNYTLNYFDGSVVYLREDNKMLKINQ